MAVLGLGKFGGRELGYASDLELLVVYEGPGTHRSERIENGAFFDRLVQDVVETLEAREEGIFHIDLRLRPHGKKGPLASPLALLREYYRTGGEAHPFERQALIKLRAVAGDPALGAEALAVRDAFVWSGEPWDMAEALRLRERQVTELVPAGRFNVKLSRGGLVDVEYTAQYLQIQHGRDHAELRTPRTLEALWRPARLGILDRRGARRSPRGLRVLAAHGRRAAHGARTSLGPASARRRLRGASPPGASPRIRGTRLGGGRRRPRRRHRPPPPRGASGVRPPFRGYEALAERARRRRAPPRRSACTALGVRGWSREAPSSGRLPAALLVAQAEGAQRAALLGVGERVGLGVGHHLKLVLDVAQEHVGLGEDPGLLGRQRGRCSSRAARAAGCCAREAAGGRRPCRAWRTWATSSISRMPPGPELDVPVALVPRRDLPVDLALDPPHLLDLRSVRTAGRRRKRGPGRGSAPRAPGRPPPARP